MCDSIILAPDPSGASCFSGFPVVEYFLNHLKNTSDDLKVKRRKLPVMDTMKERYRKQSLFYGLGETGQMKLQEGRVLVIGCGGLGTPVVNLLVRAGVGFLRVVDQDVVELSNLHRQILYFEEDVNRRTLKVDAAKNYAEKVNRQIELEAVNQQCTGENILSLMEGVHLVIDCTDNFPTRFIINDGAYKAKVPWIYGGAVESHGNVHTFFPDVGPCLRCMMTDPLEKEETQRADTHGVLNTITGMIATYQASEAIKYLSGNRDKMMDTMIHVNLWENDFERIPLMKKEDCPCCVKRDFEFLR